MPVLIIDDDAAFRAALERDLRQSGYTVYVSAGFESMVEVLLKATPRTAIVDAHLPYGESRQAVRVLHRCGIPVVLLNERDAPVDRWEGATIRGDATLTKPVGLVELEQHLRQLRPPTP
jgi:DNA-binding response OmpR family regulator